MATIISIGTSVPAYQHKQEDILHFMQDVFDLDDTERRKLKYLYHQSAIKTRHSVIPDFSLPVDEWNFIPQNNLDVFPDLDKRMEIYELESLKLSLEAIHNCLQENLLPNQITHLITVSCTGMSAPGLDLQLVEALKLNPNLFRTSVNFMGCYAAIHALKLAKLVVDGNNKAKVLVVCTELCTLHFQKEYKSDNVSSSLLFSDGCAAVLITNGEEKSGFKLRSFYSEIENKGKGDMSWKLSSKGFLMSLSSYVADIIKADIAKMVTNATTNSQLTFGDINHWCIHPGGRKILESVEQALSIDKAQLVCSYDVLADYGNMSSPTILFVMKQLMEKATKGEHLFGCAFGPGLTMETLIATYE